MQEHRFRTAIADDIHEIALFLEKHGPNKWNYLPKEGVANEIATYMTEELTQKWRNVREGPPVGGSAE